MQMTEHPEKGQWRWGDEEGAPADPEAAPLFTPEQEEILAEAELLLATGKTIEEVQAILIRARRSDSSERLSGEEGDHN